MLGCFLVGYLWVGGAQSRVESLILGSSFVFLGEQTAARAGEGQAAVRVTRVVDGNAFAKGLTGKTVFTNRPGKKGKFVFFTNGLAYGKTILLGEVGRIAPEEATRFGMRLQGNDIAVPAVRLAQRIRAAAVVVRGTVADVREAPRSERAPVTEHDPKWMIATITTSEVLKGQRAGRYLVAFPGGNDPLWEKLPRFKQGQTGTFILSSERLFLQPQKTFSMGSPLDFQGEGRDELVKAAMRRGG
jgi:hypothetical protein